MSCLPYKNEGDLNDSQNVGGKRGKYENKNFYKYYPRVTCMFVSWRILVKGVMQASTPV